MPANWMTLEERSAYLRTLDARGLCRSHEQSATVDGTWCPACLASYEQSQRAIDAAEAAENERLGSGGYWR